MQLQTTIISENDKNDFAEFAFMMSVKIKNENETSPIVPILFVRYVTISSRKVNFTQGALEVL